MSITIAEALQLPVMKETKLVAGKHGIHKEIKWVTIVEVLEDFSRLQDGEFLITTGYGWKQNPSLLTTIISELVNRNLSGLAIHMGFYVDEIPAEVIDAANRNHFPVIAIPRHFNFSTITKVLLQQIINRQMKIHPYSANINREKEDFLAEVFAGQTQNPAALAERGKALGYPLSGQQHVVICFQFQPPSNPTSDLINKQESKQYWDGLYYFVQYTLQQLNITGILRLRADRLELLQNQQSIDDGTEVAKATITHWQQSYPMLPLIAGVGSSAFTPDEIPKSLQEAGYALKCRSLLPHNEPILRFADLEPYHLVIDMMEHGMDLDSFYRKILGQLINEKKAGHAFDNPNPLLVTLEKYLDANCNMQNTAAALFIHRHTLKYRLQQIERKTGKSLSSPHNRLQLQLAIMALRLVNALHENNDERRL